jgi:FtsZ-interacting cell division protein ZipA
MKPSTDFTTILIILIVVAVIAGVFVVLWKFGYLKIKIWKKKEEEEYYY